MTIYLWIYVLFYSWLRKSKMCCLHSTPLSKGERCPVGIATNRDEGIALCSFTTASNPAIRSCIPPIIWVLLCILDTHDSMENASSFSTILLARTKWYNLWASFVETMKSRKDSTFLWFLLMKDSLYPLIMNDLAVSRILPVWRPKKNSLKVAGACV